MPGRTAMAERVAIARRQDRCCRLCEQCCSVDRRAGELGRCGAGTEARVFRHRIEYGEELELVPSHLFYLSGCNMRCVFCIGQRAAQEAREGLPLTADRFAEAVAWGRQQGAVSLQWVGGEPTIHLPAILELMASQPQLPRVVWKSNFYATPEAMDLLDGMVDVYVADFKFGNDECAWRLAGVAEYVRPVTRNLLVAAERGELIVRHLLLPGHFDCCYRVVVDWMQRHLPEAKFSIREGYVPSWHSHDYAELARPLARGEGARAHALAGDRGLNVVR